MADELTGIEEAPEAQEVDYKAEMDKWKTNSRKWENLAKSNANAAKELEELKLQLAESQDTAAKATAEAQQLKAQREHEQLKAQVAEEMGVPVDLVIGDTKEAMTDYATKLKAYLPDSTKPVVGSDGFAPITTGAPKTTREQFAEAIENQFTM